VNVTVENLGPCKRLVRVEVEPDKVESTFEEITRDFQKEARLPGFRPGKAPKDMVTKRYATEIQDEAKRKLIGDSYRKAIADNKLTVVGRPDVEEIQFSRGQPLQFAATLEIAPEFELPPYKGLPAQRDPTPVSDADIERALKLLAERQATFQTITREIKEGDIAVVNYKGTVDGKPLTDLAPTARGLTEKENFWINVDKTSFLSGFGDQLIGMKAGDKRTIKIDFPADFVTPQLAGLKANYDVTLVEVKEKVLPALNDEFAKSYDAESVEKLREGVRADLQNELNQKRNRDLRKQVMQALLDPIKADLPESVVEQETRGIVYHIVSENQGRGVPKDALDAQKDQIYATAAVAARERVKASFAFQKIAEKEGIRVEQLEIAGRLQAMAAQHKMPVDKLVKELEKNGTLGDVYQQLLHEKVVDLLVQYAKVEDVVPAAATEPMPA
jgi:trigger factor